MEVSANRVPFQGILFYLKYKRGSPSFGTPIFRSCSTSAAIPSIRGFGSSGKVGVVLQYRNLEPRAAMLLEILEDDLMDPPTGT